MVPSGIDQVSTLQYYGGWLAPGSPVLGPVLVSGSKSTAGLEWRPLPGRLHSGQEGGTRCFR